MYMSFLFIVRWHGTALCLLLLHTSSKSTVNISMSWFWWIEESARKLSITINTSCAGCRRVDRTVSGEEHSYVVIVIVVVVVVVVFLTVLVVTLKSRSPWSHKGVGAPGRSENAYHSCNGPSVVPVEFCRLPAIYNACEIARHR